MILLLQMFSFSVINNLGTPSPELHINFCMLQIDTENSTTKVLFTRTVKSTLYKFTAFKEAQSGGVLVINKKYFLCVNKRCFKRSFSGKNLPHCYKSFFLSFSFFSPYHILLMQCRE